VKLNKKISYLKAYK